MIRYCPYCWAENAYEASACATCGATLDETGKDFADRLIDAISHPEPTRAVIAVEILGRLRESRAVAALLARLSRQPDSMDVTTAIAEALGLIGEERAIPALSALLLDGKRPLVARLAAAEALALFGNHEEARQALATAVTETTMPRLLRQALQKVVHERQTHYIL